MASKRPRLTGPLNSEFLTKNQIPVPYFDLIPNEIFSLITTLFDADSYTVVSCPLSDSKKARSRSHRFFLRSRKAFLETAQRFHKIGQTVFDPSVFINLPLRHAAKNGYIDEVQRLLSDSRVEANAWDDAPIRLASKSGHYDIVALLLREESVNSSARRNYPILRALLNGHSMVVDLLESHVRIPQDWLIEHGNRTMQIMIAVTVTRHGIPDDRLGWEKTKGFLNMLKELRGKNYDILTTHTLVWAATSAFTESFFVNGEKRSLIT